MAEQDNELIELAKEQFAQALDAFEANQTRYEKDVKFGRMGEQWNADDIEERKNQGRPSLTINRMPSFIRQVVNDARQNKPSIKVHPFDDTADPDTAEVINGIIRNIEQVSKADLAYDTAIDCATSGGFGYFRIDLDYADDDTFDLDIRINRILNPLTIYPDAASTSADSSDWNYCFVTEMMPRDEFEDQYPNAEAIDWSPTHLDDNDQAWYDKDQVRVAEYWVREPINKTIYLMSTGDVVSEEIYNELQAEYEATGIELLNTRETTSYKVTQYIMNGQEVLETNEWPGKYIPIVPLYGEEIFIDGERHFFSLIHFAKDAQTIYNYWRTTTTELVAMSPKTPWIGPAGAFDTDLDRWQNANTETYSYLEYDGEVPPQRQPFAGPPAGALQEALNASDDMKSVMGLHDASMGAQSNEISGVAINKRVREGDTSTYHFIDNMARAIRHAGVIIVDLMPLIYSKPRMMRVLGEDGMAQTVAVNQPITEEQQMLQGQQMMEKFEAMSAIYDLTVGKYDVTVKAGPSYTTQREEARESMIALLQAFPQAASVTGDLVVDAMDWPNSDVFAKRLKALLPPGVADDRDDPRIAQMAQQMQGMEQVINQLMADREGKQAAIQVDREKLVIDSRKVDIDYMQAETKRMEAEIKNKEADIKAAEAMREDSPNNTPIMVKQMDNAMKEVALTQEAQIATDKLNIEREKLDLERDKLNLEKYKADMDASVKMAGKTDVDVTINDIEVSPAE
tara:strand:+ start:833 stop:3049 length:2217 start_codon:yes stop_codon:yes gene_type:complete